MFVNDCETTVAISNAREAASNSCKRSPRRSKTNCPPLVDHFEIGFQHLFNIAACFLEGGGLLLSDHLPCRFRIELDQRRVLQRCAGSFGQLLIPLTHPLFDVGEPQRFGLPGHGWTEPVSARSPDCRHALDRVGVGANDADVDLEEVQLPRVGVDVF